MEDHEQLRRELESAASALREDTDRRRKATLRTLVVSSALGISAAGLVVLGAFLVNRDDQTPVPAQHSDSAPAVTSRRPTTTHPPTPPEPPGQPPSPDPASQAAPDPEQRRVHTVQRGETLARIALRYNVPFEQIAEDNGITNPNRIRVGQRLVIRPAAPGTIVIQPGDTLSAIARRHGTTVQTLLARNPHITNPNRITAGGRLRVS